MKKKDDFKSWQQNWMKGKGRKDSEKEKWRNTFVKKKRYKNLLRVFKNIWDHACGHDLYNERNLQSTCEWNPTLNMYTVFIRLSAKPQISAHLE